MPSIDPFQIVRRGDAQGLRHVMNEVDVNLTDIDGRNLLHSAIVSGSVDMADLLIGRNIDVNLQDNAGLTPLHFAAMYRRPDMAALILDAGGDMSVEDVHGNQPLWTAVFNARGQYDVVRMLILRGADGNHVNRHGKSPLDFARQIRDEGLIMLLQRSGTGT